MIEISVIGISIRTPLTGSKLFTGDKLSRRLARFSIQFLVLALLFLPAACNSPIDAAADESANVDAAATTDNTNAQTATTAAEIAPINPLDEEQTQPPVRIQIPDIGLDAEIEEMGWQIVMVDGERTTRWALPESGLGWHANSAGVGEAGNTILSGRQIGADAPFASLAVGDVQIGQEVHLTDSDGITFVYRITEVSEPIPAAGATEEDLALATTYLSPTDSPRLTLATGWPEFTTTHRIFAVGELEGVAR